MIRFIFISGFLGSLLIHVWHRLTDLTPLPWDPLSHLIFTLDYSEMLTAKNYYDFFNYFKWYTPFVYWIGSLITPYVLNSLLPLAINIIFLLSFLLGLYFCYPKKNKEYFFLTALLFLHIVIPESRSVFWYANDPYTLSLRGFWLDIPLALLVCNLYTLSLFLRDKNKLNPLHLIILAISLTATALTKNAGFIYALPFLAIYLMQIVLTKSTPAVKFFYTLILLTLLAVLNKWFKVNYAEFIKINNIHIANGYAENDPQGLGGFWLNLIWIINYSLLYFSTLCLVGVVLTKRLFSDLRKNYTRLFTPTYILILLVAFSVIPNKDPRYILPLTWLTYYALSRYLGEMITGKYLITAIWLLSIFLPLRTYLNLPPRLQTQPAYYYVDSLLAKQNPKAVGFFYEVDSPYFNYVSTQYLSRVHRIPYQNLNENSPGSKSALKNCLTRQTEELIFVYSVLDKSLINKEGYASFQENCAKKIAGNCKFERETKIRETNEHLKVYRCS